MRCLVIVLLLCACAPVAVVPPSSLPAIPYEPLPGDPAPVAASQPAPVSGYVLTVPQLKTLDGQIRLCEEARELAYMLGREEVEASLRVANKRLVRWQKWTGPAVLGGVLVGLAGGVLLTGALAGGN